MRALHLGVAVIAVLTGAANLALGAPPWLAVAAGVAVGGFGEATGLFVRPRQAGPPADGPPAAGAAPLSRRELEVARLVAQGLRNKEVASRLGIAERTVDNHVQHIYNRLDIGSRAELALWLRDRGLV